MLCMLCIKRGCFANQPSLYNSIILCLIANGDLVTSLSLKISISSGEQCGKGHAEVPLCGELVDGCSTNGGPHEGVG